MHQPFIDDSSHARALDGQRFVVLRLSSAVQAAYEQVQGRIREHLDGLPVSYPARGHVTLCGFARGTSIHEVQDLVRRWAATMPPLRIEVFRISAFPLPFAILIVEVQRNPPLYTALTSLRQRAAEEGLHVSTVTPVEKWTFHMSLAYCPRLDPERWKAVKDFAEALPVPPVYEDVLTAEVVGFDGGQEQLVEVFELRAESAP